ncbi:MAG: pentapeptide repeat-containing protein [Brasilonema sp.]
MTRKVGLTQLTIVVLVVVLIFATVTIVYLSQILVERGAIPINVQANSTTKQQYEISKVAAEIQRIRSDTQGSLFWLKMIALFVTVGGAVGGYLIGQSRATQARISFEDRKNVDLAYQSIVQELSSEAPLLRAAAAVKLGSILESFPAEWNVSEKRQLQLVQLTKQIIASALAIEENDKVLKTLTISLMFHKPWEKCVGEKKQYSDVRGQDLSGVKAIDSYWARADFTYTDFYRAQLQNSSFRKSILCSAQFRDAKLNEAVLADSNCEEANFKFADLRNADFSRANLRKASFEGAHVFGCILVKAEFGDNPEYLVDISENGDNSQMISFSEWLKANSYQNGN